MVEDGRNGAAFYQNPNLDAIEPAAQFFVPAGDNDVVEALERVNADLRVGAGLGGSKGDECSRRVDIQAAAVAAGVHLGHERITDPSLNAFAMANPSRNQVRQALKGRRLVGKTLLPDRWRCLDSNRKALHTGQGVGQLSALYSSCVALVAAVPVIIRNVLLGLSNRLRVVCGGRSSCHTMPRYIWR